MKNPQCLFAIIVVLGTCAPDRACLAAAENADTIAGKWEVTWVQFGTTNVGRIELQKVGGQLSGKGLWNCAVEGTFAGDKLDLKLVNSNKKTQATLSGAIE